MRPQAKDHSIIFANDRISLEWYGNIIWLENGYSATLILSHNQRDKMDDHEFEWPQ